ncbi:hypothetical protein [Colwellia sp. BRX10-4]|jgi:hypothetical protein|uniref:hypothetical protein n=1 Tax=Colwellia sp. BRX10-4 TaxID=2759843 RepID=UPI0015F74003|nr:hypothetical protein [Colwellia sp. BRX10-4]MBA6399827.1 hypothetical protein [Colwellia sp. BRX10-4]
MFKIGGKIKKLTTSGATNFRSSELVFRNNIIKVNSTIRSYLFESYFHLFNCYFFYFISSIILEDTGTLNPYEEIFWIFIVCLLVSTIFRVAFGLRAKIKYFDLDAKVFYVANSFKKRMSIPLAEIDKLYLIRFHNSSTNNNYNGYEFSLTTKSDATYLLMNHSDFYSMKNEIKKLADILGVPFEILVAGDIYEDPILE